MRQAVVNNIVKKTANEDVKKLSSLQRNLQSTNNEESIKLLKPKETGI